MDVAIIKYNAGNIKSVIFALERIGINPIVTDNPDELRAADKVIFPGVGEASTAMSYLKARKLDKVIVSLKQPVLGICLGMQLMCKHSEEGDTICLGIFDLNVRKFNGELKVPQIGWNTITGLQSKLFTGVNEKDYMYFVHSYYVENGLDAIARTEYGISFSSALEKNNYYAVQFHPEKSSKSGQQVLENFLKVEC